MCMKLSSGNLNPDLYPPHPTITYTCGVTIALRVYDNKLSIYLFLLIDDLTLFNVSCIKNVCLFFSFVDLLDQKIIIFIYQTVKLITIICSFQSICTYQITLHQIYIYIYKPFTYKKKKKKKLYLMFHAFNMYGILYFFHLWIYWI